MPTKRQMGRETFKNKARTLPFTFQVPAKTVHLLVAEYSGSLRMQSGYAFTSDSNDQPSFQGLTDKVMYRIKNGDLLLRTEIALLNGQRQ